MLLYYKKGGDFLVRGRKAVTSEVPYKIEEIKKGLEAIIGMEVQWNKNYEDRRKNTIYLRGIIDKTYSHLFSIKLNNGRTVTFTYQDIYAKNIKLLSTKTGSNVLKKIV